jgi:hypothetical protein
MNTGEKTPAIRKIPLFISREKKQADAPGIFPVNEYHALTGYGMAID